MAGQKTLRRPGERFAFPIAILLGALAVALALPDAARAAIITWDGGGLTGNWSDALNWSTNTVPGAADTAVFNGTSAKPTTIALANVNVGGVQVDATYGGSITQGAGRSITVGVAGWTQSGSTFTGSAAAITMNGPFSLSGGTFTSTSGTLTLAGALTQAGGTFLHASGTVRFTGAAAAIDVPGSMSLWNVNFTHNNAVPKTIAAGDTLVVLGLLTLTNGSVDGDIVAARGDLLQTATFDGGTASLRIDGGGAQTLSGTATTAAGQLPNLVIDKPGGTLTLAGTIRTARDWTYLGGSLAPSASSVVFAGTQTIAGDHSLFNVEFRSALVKTIAVGTTLGVDGLLTLTDGDLNDGTVEARGDITAAAAFDGETATLRIAGSGDQTFTGAATSTAGELPNVVIDKPSGTLTLAGTLRVFTGAWTYVAGILDPGASSVVFDTVAAIGGDHTLFNVEFRGGTHSVAAGDTLFVSGLLTLSDGTVDAGTVAARGDLLQTATFDGGTGALHIDGAGDQTFSGTATTTAGQLPDLVIDKPGGTLTLAGTIRTTSDWTHLAGALDPDASSVVFAGVLNVTMDGAPLFRVQVHGGVTTLGAPLTTLSDLEVTAGTLSTGGLLLDVDGDLLVTGTLDGGGSEIHVAGDVTLAGTFDPGGGRLTLDGTVLQTLMIATAVLADLTVANPAGAVLASDLTVQGELELASGMLTIGPFRLTIMMPIAGTPTNLVADSTSSITIAGSSADIRLPASVTDLAELAITNPLWAAIDGPLAIHATLVLAGGNLAAGPHLVTIEAGGGVSRTSGHVIGSLRKAVSAGGALSMVFEIGDANGYTPIEVSWPSVSASGTLTASTLGEDPPSLSASGLDAAASVNRTWTLVPEGLSADPHSVTLTFLAAEVDPGLDPSSALGAAFDGATWTLPPVSARSATSIGLDVPAMGAVSFGAAMPAADLAVTLAGPISVVVGVASTYQAIISSAGPLAAPPVVLTITLPAGATLHSVASGGGTCTVAGQTITCDLGPLAAGEQVTVDLRLSFGAAGLHVLTAVASIGSGASDPSPADDVAELRVTAAEPVAGPTPPGTPGSLPDTAGTMDGAPMLIGIALLLSLAVLLPVGARARGRRARR